MEDRLEGEAGQCCALGEEDHCMALFFLFAVPFLVVFLIVLFVFPPTRMGQAV
jgi:hypothetical protein